MVLPRQNDQVDEWKTTMFLYKSALKQVTNKIEILTDEFIEFYHYNPIEHVKSRIKTAQSITRKLKRDGKEVTIFNMKRYLSDIAGVRIICSFTSDIYMIADMISNQADVNVIAIKNYIEEPKPNGYKSYHMVVSIPVFLADGPVDVKVEIQIRTIAMDFWASLEHKIYYKFDGEAPAYISKELKACANMVNMLDAKMLSLNQAVQELEKKMKEQEEPEEKRAQ